MLRGIEELCDQQQTWSLLQAASIKHSSYPTPFSSAFVILKSLWSAELLLSWGKTHRELSQGHPSKHQGWLEHFGAGTASSCGSPRASAACGVPQGTCPGLTTAYTTTLWCITKSWVSLFKKRTLVLTVSCPSYRTDLAVSLSNRWPGSHIANQVTHSEGISQMISYHVLNSAPKTFLISNLWKQV